LGCGEWPRRQQLGDRVRPLEGLFDDVGDLAVRSDVEDAAESDVVQTGAAAGSIQDGIDVRVPAAHGEQQHRPIEGGIPGGPLFGTLIRGGAVLGGVPTTQDGAWPDPLHYASSDSIP